MQCFHGEPEVIPVATGGSSKFDVASWAILFPWLDRKISDGVAGEDQSSYRAETEALRMLLKALVEAADLVEDGGSKSEVII